MVVRENFLCEIWGCGILWGNTSEQSANVLSAKIMFLTNSRKISPSKVSRYTVSRLLSYFTDEHNHKINTSTSLTRNYNPSIVGLLNMVTLIKSTVSTKVLSAATILTTGLLHASQFGCPYSLDWKTGLDYWTGLLD